MTQLYRMHDDPTRSSPAIACRDAAEARLWNTPERGYGIFWTVNKFRDTTRRKDNLEQILSWCVDMDEGTKAEMVAKINRSPLVPTQVIETKRGYQVYWFAQDGHAEHWNAIMLERLVPWFGADDNARDLARILRAPGFLHLKHPAEPFKCELRHRWAVKYTERQMADAFPWVASKVLRVEAQALAKREHRAATNIDAGEDFWQAVYNLDCVEGLARLSGHAACGGEKYTFRQNSNGNTNVFVDGKGTSVFVDSGGRIGSSKKGGPTLYQWLRWYGVQPREAVDILKQTFPQLADIDARNRTAWVAKNRRAA